MVFWQNKVSMCYYFARISKRKPINIRLVKRAASWEIPPFRTYSKNYVALVISRLEPYSIPRIKINDITLETESLNNDYLHAGKYLIVSELPCNIKKRSTTRPQRIVNQGK